MTRSPGLLRPHPAAYSTGWLASPAYGALRRSLCPAGSHSSGTWSSTLTRPGSRSMSSPARSQSTMDRSWRGVSLVLDRQQDMRRLTALGDDHRPPGRGPLGSADIAVDVACTHLGDSCLHRRYVTYIFLDCGSKTEAGRAAPGSARTASGRPRKVLSVLPEVLSWVR